MKKLLFVLPTLLLITAPTAVLADKKGRDNHGSEVRMVAQSNRSSETEEHKSQQDENKSEKDESIDNEVHPEATVSATAKDNQQLKIKVFVKNHPVATASATQSATPSARVSVSGPLDQVIKALESIINFLKSLI